jgi:hypothetical protein
MFKQFKKLYMIYPEDEGTTLRQSIGIYLPVDVTWALNNTAVLFSDLAWPVIVFICLFISCLSPVLALFLYVARSKAACTF